MKIELAREYGMCFGVRDALEAATKAAEAGPVTVLGEIVHNPVAAARLRARGAGEGRLDDVESARTKRVLVTAHGASEQDRERWRHAGHALIDTTCPLVRRAHAALKAFVREGRHPVVVGRKGHVEVMGLIGDFPGATVLEGENDIASLPREGALGIVSQTTQPLSHVREVVEHVRRLHPHRDIGFRDTVCQPTKDRQKALEELCLRVEIVVVVGGRNSHNTRQLVASARAMDRRTEQVERADELRADWFQGLERVGVTAGTSTLEETVREVVAALHQIDTVRSVGDCAGAVR